MRAAVTDFYRLNSLKLVIGQGEKNISFFNRHDVERNLEIQYATWFGNKTQEMLKVFEDGYLTPGTTDDDSMAWMNLYVDVNHPANSSIQRILGRDGGVLHLGRATGRRVLCCQQEPECLHLRIRLVILLGRCREHDPELSSLDFDS